MLSNYEAGAVRAVRVPRKFRSPFGSRNSSFAELDEMGPIGQVTAHSSHDRSSPSGRADDGIEVGVPPKALQAWRSNGRNGVEVRYLSCSFRWIRRFLAGVVCERVDGLVPQNLKWQLASPRRP